MKKCIKIIIQILFYVAQFIIINIIIAFSIWVTRDKKLIEITNLHNMFIFDVILFETVLSLGLIPFLIVILLNSKKLYNEKSFIFTILIPFKIIIFLFLLLTFFLYSHLESLNHLYPLIDTSFAKYFNVYNIDKIQKYMKEDEIVSLLGDPLEIRKHNENIIYQFTQDGKSIIGDWAWLEVYVIFEDGKVIEKSFKWVYD